jgi:hypothetical protein
MASELSAFYILLKRDLILAYRHRSELANPLLFFIIVISLFPLGISPESKKLTGDRSRRDLGGSPTGGDVVTGQPISFRL